MKHDENCIFCKIIKGDIPSYKIYEDELTYAFLDIAKDAYGHTLVIPKNHCVNILDADNETHIAVCNTVKRISEHYVKTSKCAGVNTFNCNNVEAEQSVFHYHVHIIPRKKDDGIHIWNNKVTSDIDLEKVQNELKLN